MRGFLIGLFLILFLTISVLSLRPGGVRNQLRNIARRLKLALALAGLYLLASAALRVAFGDDARSTWGTAAVGAVLAVVFLVLAQDRQLER